MHNLSFATPTKDTVRAQAIPRFNSGLFMPGNEGLCVQYALKQSKKWPKQPRYMLCVESDEDVIEGVHAKIQRAYAACCHPWRIEFHTGMLEKLELPPRKFDFIFADQCGELDVPLIKWVVDVMSEAMMNESILSYSGAVIPRASTFLPVQRELFADVRIGNRLRAEVATMLADSTGPVGRVVSGAIECQDMNDNVKTTLGILRVLLADFSVQMRTTLWSNDGRANRGNPGMPMFTTSLKLFRELQPVWLQNLRTKLRQAAGAVDETAVTMRRIRTAAARGDYANVRRAYDDGTEHCRKAIRDYVSKKGNMNLTEAALGQSGTKVTPMFGLCETGLF